MFCFHVPIGELGGIFIHGKDEGLCFHTIDSDGSASSKNMAYSGKSAVFIDPKTGHSGSYELVPKSHSPGYFLIIPSEGLPNSNPEELQHISANITGGILLKRGTCPATPAEDTGTEAARDTETCSLNQARIPTIKIDAPEDINSNFQPVTRARCSGYFIRCPISQAPPDIPRGTTSPRDISEGRADASCGGRLAHLPSGPGLGLDVSDTGSGPEQPGSQALRMVHGTFHRLMGKARRVLADRRQNCKTTPAVDNHANQAPDGSYIMDDEAIRELVEAVVEEMRKTQECVSTLFDPKRKPSVLTDSILPQAPTLAGPAATIYAPETLVISKNSLDGKVYTRERASFDATANTPRPASGGMASRTAKGRNSRSSSYFSPNAYRSSHVSSQHASDGSSFALDREHNHRRFSTLERRRTSFADLRRTSDWLAPPTDAAESEGPVPCTLYSCGVDASLGTTIEVSGVPADEPTKRRPYNSSFFRPDFSMGSIFDLQHLPERRATDFGMRGDPEMWLRGTGQTQGGSPYHRRSLRTLPFESPPSSEPGADRAGIFERIRKHSIQLSNRLTAVFQSQSRNDAQGRRRIPESSAGMSVGGTDTPNPPNFPGTPFSRARVSL